MHFEPSEEQKILKKTAEDFLGKECPKDLVRGLVLNGGGYPKNLWHQMAKLGWMGLILPEAYGGSGMTFRDLAILLEVMGYYLCPSPFISTILGGALPILIHGTASQKTEYLPRLAAGEMVLTMAVLEESGVYAAQDIEMSAVRKGDDFVFNGCKLFVPNALDADQILCLTRTGKAIDPAQGLTIFLLSTRTPGLTIKPMKSISHNCQGALVFDNVKIPSQNILGEEGHGWPVVLEALSWAALGQAAEMIGGARAAFDLAKTYAKERIQFDRPIGSFPAIQAYFTDMWILLTGARMLTMKAATNLSKGVIAEGEIAMAKAKAGEAYRTVTTLSHQIFGAIGFCLEHDLHLFHRHAITADHTYGGVEEQHKIIAKAIGL